MTRTVMEVNDMIHLLLSWCRRKSVGRIIMFLVPCMLFFAGCSKEVQPPVKNIVFFIGDGMGFTALTLTHYYSLHLLEQELAMTAVMNQI